MAILPGTIDGRNMVPDKPCLANGASPPVKPPRIALAAPGDEPDCFLERECRAGCLSSRTLTLQELLERTDADVDLYLDEATGRISIQPRIGPRLRYRGTIPGLGRVGRPLLDDLMWQPGELLCVARLIRNPALRSLASPSVRATRLKSLRRAFHDSDGWFFELARNPWRLRWNPERSWRLIEPLANGGSPPEMRDAA